MAFQQSDLDRLDAAILSGTKSVRYADGREVTYHSLDEMRRLRIDIKTELSAAASRVSPLTRTVVGRVRR